MSIKSLTRISPLYAAAVIAWTRVRPCGAPVLCLGATFLCGCLQGQNSGLFAPKRFSQFKLSFFSAREDEDHSIILVDSFTPNSASWHRPGAPPGRICGQAIFAAEYGRLMRVNDFVDNIHPYVCHIYIHVDTISQSTAQASAIGSQTCVLSLLSSVLTSRDRGKEEIQETIKVQTKNKTNDLFKNIVYRLRSLPKK